MAGYPHRTLDIDEFQELIRRKSDPFTKGFNCLTSVACVVAAIYFALTPGKFPEIRFGLFYYYLLVLFMLFLGAYGLNVLLNAHKIKVYSNGLIIEENIRLLSTFGERWNIKTMRQEANHFVFIYKKHWWQLSYSIHLLAAEGALAIHVASQKTGTGFADLGSSARLSRKILRALGAPCLLLILY